MEERRRKRETGIVRDCDAETDVEKSMSVVLRFAWLQILALQIVKLLKCISARTEPARAYSLLEGTTCP